LPNLDTPEDFQKGGEDVFRGKTGAKVRTDTPDYPGGFFRKAFK
jgi:hypothetical protein